RLSGGGVQFLPPRTESPGQDRDEPDAGRTRHRARHHLLLQIQQTSRVSCPVEQSICAAEPGGAPQRTGRRKPSRSESTGESSAPPRRPAPLSRRQRRLSPVRGRTEEVLEPAGAQRSEWLPAAASD